MDRAIENTVLVVDDAPDQLEIMSLLLRNSGYTVLTAFDGREGFEAARAARPSLVVSDVQMPHMDGIEMCRLVRQHPDLCLTPFLLVSANRRDSESIIEGLRVGADDYLEAPYDPMRFVAKVSRLLEKRRAEELLKQSAEQFRVLIENSSDLISILQPDGTMKYESPSVRRILGYRPEELVGKNVFDFIHPDDVAGISEGFRYTVERGGIIQLFQYRFRHKDGSWRFFESIGRTSVGESGELVAVINSRDLTERRRTEEQLRQSRSQLAEAQRLARVGSWNWEVQGDVLTWSDELYRIYGLSPEEHTPTRENFFASIHPEDRAGVLQMIEDSMRKRQPASHYFRIIRPDGGVRIIISHRNVFCDDEGRPTRAFGTLQDVTERKQAEELLRNSNEELRALSARLQAVREEESIRIAREIHDDLGGALTGLKMDVSWLGRRGATPGEEAVRQKLRSMSELIDETIQKVRSIATELRPSLLDDLGLAAAIEWQAREFQKRTEIECRIVTLKEDVALSPEKSTAVFRIFQEILTNVGRHARATRVWINLEQPDGELVLRVADDGRGISGADLSDTKSLGLLGMRERALVFGGRVEISGAEGAGTTVVVSIPLQ